MIFFQKHLGMAIETALPKFKLQVHSIGLAVTRDMTTQSVYLIRYFSEPHFDRQIEIHPVSITGQVYPTSFLLSHLGITPPNQAVPQGTTSPQQDNVVKAQAI